MAEYKMAEGRKKEIFTLFALAGPGGTVVLPQRDYDYIVANQALFAWNTTIDVKPEGKPDWIFRLSPLSLEHGLYRAEHIQDRSDPKYRSPIPSRVPTSPLDTQVGGSHYKGKNIQPITYCMANGLNACESAVVKYITRWADKGGVQDLEKIKHYVDLLIQLDPRAQKNL